LRIAAAVPDAAGGPLGLNALGSGIMSVVLLVLALVAWYGPRMAVGRRRSSTDASDELTLHEVIAMHQQHAAAPPPTAASARPMDPVAPPDAVAANVDHGIFRAYDIRGIVGQNLDAQVAERIGQAIGTVMQEKGLREIVVGRDGRLSGPALTEGLIQGLRLAGCDVVDIGLAPTPLVYFGAYQLNAGSCVSVTGSHNPPDYNGFKIVVGGETLSGETITDLYERIAGDRLHRAATLGGLTQRDIAEDYVQRVASDVQLDRPLKVVVDAGNGVAGDLGPRVLSAIGAEVVPLYCDIDGTFPNHHPDPSELHNLEDLIESVQRLGADLGVAFDGDGDRLGVVTREGVSIFPDRLLMLFAADVLERNPGALVIFDVKCTGRLPGHILRHGGSPLMWKTGHSLIKAKMRETDAELAGEMSGHFFFKERWYGFDDGIYSAARLLEILAAQPRSASETLNALPDGISTPEIKVDAPQGNPHAFVERFREEARFEGARLSTIDGLRVDFPDGWGLVRASNTTPVLVMRFDADSAEALARIQAAFREQLL
ncbi:MAG TPA: phosphomannomutase/phosphoglucomutase, partial [Lysobacter sp.]